MDDINWQESYEMVRDAIIQHLNPWDGDEAEEAIMIAAIERAAKALNHVLDLDADGVIALPPGSLQQVGAALPDDEDNYNTNGGYNPDGYILNPER